MLCLHYEKNYINELLRDLSNNMEGASGMIFGLFNKCLPKLIELISTILKNTEANIKSLELDSIEKNGYVNGRVKLILAIGVLGVETVASIAFSNLVRMSGHEGGVEEMDIINRISDAIFIHMKHKKKMETKVAKGLAKL